MNKTFEKIYSENNVILNKDMVLKENTALFEKVYAEAEMLNEMNPKLRALLAAGLIGTAGLGATSCSTPNDDYEEPTVIEQPATPETPGSTTETPAEPETPAETEDTKETAALSGFKALGVEDYAENLARTRKDPTTYDQIDPVLGFTSYRYKENGFGRVGFKIDEKGEEGQWDGDGQIYIRYIDIPTLKIFYVPKSLENTFDDAIAAYKAAHAE